MLWKNLDRLKSLFEWARMRCRGRVIDAFEPKSSEDLAPENQQTWLEEVLFVANEIAPKYIDMIFKLASDELDDDSAEEHQAYLRVAVVLIARLANHPGLTKGMDAIAKILVSGKSFYKKNGVGANKPGVDSDEEEDEEEEFEDDEEGEIRVPVGLDLLSAINKDDDFDFVHFPTPYLAPDFDVNAHRGEGENELSDEQVIEVQQLIVQQKIRAQRYRAALDFTALSAPSMEYFDSYHFGAKDLVKEIKREVREEKRRRKANRRAKADGIERSDTPSSTSSSNSKDDNNSETDSQSEASGTALHLSSELPASLGELYQTSPLADDPTLDPFDNVFMEEDPSMDQVDGGALRRRTRIGPYGEETDSEDDDGEEDEDTQYRYVNLHDEQNWLFTDGYLSKKSQLNTSVYVRKHANYIVRSGTAAIMLRRVLKCSILHPAVVNRHAISPSLAAFAAPAETSKHHAQLYPLFTSSQAAFCNFTGAFKTLCRLLSFVHASIHNQLCTHLISVYRNVFVPLSAHVEGMRQDLFIKECDELYKLVEIKLLTPSRLITNLVDPQQSLTHNEAQLAALSHVSSYRRRVPPTPVILTIPGHGSAPFCHLYTIDELAQLSNLAFACPWNFAAAQSPIMDCLETPLKFPAPAARFANQPQRMPCNFITTDRASDDISAELQLIRALASLDCRVLERRLQGMNALVDLAKESGNILILDLERQVVLLDYETKLARYQNDLAAYKNEMAARQSSESSETRHLPLVPPRKPEHPLTVSNTGTHTGFYAHQHSAHERKVNQMNTYNALTFPLHCALPLLLQQHAETLLKSFFGARAHVAVVPKAREVLAFFSQQSLLTTAHLDYIWHSHLSKHISIVHLVWEVLDALTPTLKLELVDHLFGLIQRDIFHPEQSSLLLTSQLFGLLKTITSVGIQMQESVLQEEIEGVRKVFESSRNNIETELQLASQELQQQGTELSEDEHAERLTALEAKARAAAQEAEMSYENSVAHVQAQPRKLYGLWTMLLVLTDGNCLGSQVTVALIHEIVTGFFRPLLEWVQCLGLRLPLLVHLLARIHRQSSVAQSIMIFSAILGTFIPHKTFLSYSPTQRDEFPLIANLPHLQDQRSTANLLSLVPVPSPSTITGTTESATTQNLVGSLPIPLVSSHLPVSHAVSWLQEHFDLQKIIIEAMRSYKALVFQAEMGISPEEFEKAISADGAHAAQHNAIPSSFVVQCIGSKALEERRNAGIAPSTTGSTVSYLPGSPFTYLEHTGVRHTFMVEVAHVSNKQLEGDELSKWWSLVTQWSLTKRDLKAVCEHLTQLLFNYSTNHFPVSDDNMRLLMVRLENELDAYEITTAGLDLIKAFIIFRSWRNNQYVPLQTSTAYPFGFAIDGDIATIPGLGLFWKVATHAKDLKAAEQAAKHIVAFYEYPKHDSAKPLFQTAFVHNAIAILKEDYESISNVDATKAADQRTSPFLSISRCLALIRKVLSSNRSAPTTRGAPIRLTLKQMSGPTSEISLFYNDPLSMVRAKAAQLLDVSPADVRLITGGKELKAEQYDHLPISQIPPPVTITPGTHIHIIKRGGFPSSVSTSTTAAPAEAQVSTIAALLSSEPYFSLFFNLLLLASSSSEHNELAHQVWSLLMDLPHNRELINGLKSIAGSTSNGSESAMDVEGESKGAVSWDVLLDPSNCFKLFYSLQIVESLLRPREGSTDSSTQWVDAFQISGGVRHILRLILTAPLAQPEQGFKRFPAASLLLDLLSIFVSENGPSNRRVISSAAFMPLLTDPLLLTSTESSESVVQLFVQRLIELGIGSATEQIEENAGSEEQDPSESVPTTPAEPSSQDNEDDINAVARTTKTAARKEEGVASSSEVLFGQICPFILALAASPEHLITILSAPMKPAWTQIMSVVFQGGCDDLKVRSSLFNTISSLILLADQTEVSGVEFFGDIALTLAEQFLASSATATAKTRAHAGEFFSILVVVVGRMFSLDQSLVDSLAAAEELAKWQLLEQHDHSAKLIASSPSHAKFAERLNKILGQVAQLFIGYAPRERRGDTTVDAFLVGLLALARACLLLFPSWTYTHEAVVRGGDRPRLNDNPLLEPAASDSPAAQGRFSIVCSLGNLLFRIPTPSSITSTASSVTLSSSTNGAASVPPACKTVEARTAAFALLLTLTHPILVSAYAHLSGTKQNEPSAALVHLNALIENFVLPRHLGRSSIGNGVTSWNYVPLGMEKASCGYVGLRNLAATCYMNSLMQQFFMVPQFRARIFSLAPYLPEGAEAAPAQNTGKSTLLDSRNVLFQLQNLFAHLQESQLKYYDPTSFTKVYKDPDGRAMNPIVQMDAEEFFAGLLDKIESVIKGTGDEKAVRDFFGGSLWQQVEAKDCGHVSRREEEMLTIPVEVKGKANLHQSLEAFVKADILDGDNKYQCSQCNQMVDARKYACLGRLPDNLVFSLKRFDFDFESLTRVKVHDHFEFPMSLSVEPYTADGLRRKSNAAKGDAPSEEDKFDPEDYEYSLSGIVIHRGSADSGHYYSYIKDRNSSPDRPRWFLFNDMSVESFDEHDIPALAFGGEDSNRRTYKAYSAYMLFYTKKKPVQLQAQVRLDSRHLSDAVPRPLFASTWLENSSFLLDQQIYDNHYLEFATSLVTRLAIDDEEHNANDDASAVALTRLGFTLVTETLMQMKAKSWYSSVITSLNQLVRTSAAAGGALLGSLLTPQAATVLTKIFVQCPSNEIKNNFSALVSEALVALLSSKSNDSQTATKFVDLWVHKLLESADIPLSKLPLINPWETVVASVASSANVLAIALENPTARPLLAPILIPHVHSFMTLLDKKIAGPQDEESKKKYKDWRKPLAPLVSLISLLVASSNPKDVKLPENFLDASISAASPNVVVAPLDDASAYQSLALDLLPLDVYPLRVEGDNDSIESLASRPKLSEKTWDLLTSDTFLATLLDDPGLSSSVSEPTVKLFEFLGSSHPVWTRHLLILCLTRMRDVGYERFENLVAVVPILVSQLRQARQLAFDAAHETRSRLAAALTTTYGAASSAEKTTADARWSWLLFPGGNSDVLFKHFSSDYLSGVSLDDDSNSAAMKGVEASAGSFPPNFDASVAEELANLVNDKKEGGWTLAASSALKSVQTLAKAVLAHSALANWLIHKAFAGLLEAKKILKLASFWSLRCALDCVENDAEVRRAVQTEPDVSSPIMELLPHFLIFEKCERVRSIAERFCLSVSVANDERRRIWNSPSDDAILDSAVPASTLNSLFAPVPVPLLPRRFLAAEIDPLWEDRERHKNGVEVVLAGVGVLTLPGSSEYAEVQAAITHDLKAINAEMIEEQARKRSGTDKAADSHHDLVFAESLSYESDRVTVKAMVEKEVSVMTRLWGMLVPHLRAVTKGSTVTSDPNREKERPPKYEIFWKYRLVQLLRTMTWILVRVPHENKLALKTFCFESCVDVICMLWREGVSEDYDANRTALYAFIDVMSHEFSPILQSLAVQDKFLHMNIHVNLDKSCAKPICAFNDRTSGHFFRIILRTILLIDEIEKAKAGTGAQKVEAGRFKSLSHAKSLLDVGVVQFATEAAALPAVPVKSNQVLSNLSEMPAWNWSLQWLYVRGGPERYPTLAIILEQLVRFVLKRVDAPKRENVVTSVISTLESLALTLASYPTQAGGGSAFGSGAPSLLLTAILGSFAPDLYAYEHSEDADSRSAEPLPPNTDADSYTTYADGRYLSNRLDATGFFMNPYKTFATSPYLEWTMPDVAAPEHPKQSPALSAISILPQGLAVTDWSLKYPMQQMSPLVTLVLPAATPSSSNDPEASNPLKEAVTSWLQDTWVLIQHRLIGASLSFLAPPNSATASLPIVPSSAPVPGTAALLHYALSTLLSHPSATPNPSQRAAYDMLQVLRLASSWIVPLACSKNAKKSGGTKLAAFPCTVSHVQHRPLLPLQRVMFDLFCEDAVILSAAEETGGWMLQQQLRDAQQVVLTLLHALVLNPTAIQVLNTASSSSNGSAIKLSGNAAQTLSMRESLISIAIDISEAIFCLSPNVAVTALAAVREFILSSTASTDAIAALSPFILSTAQALASRVGPDGEPGDWSAALKKSLDLLVTVIASSFAHPESSNAAHVQLASNIILEMTQTSETLLEFAKTLATAADLKTLTSSDSALSTSLASIL